MKKNLATLILLNLLSLQLYSQETVETTMTTDVSNDANSVDQPAQFPGGKEALKEFMLRNLYYPEDAIEQRYQGTVYVKFAITSNGNVADIHVISSVCESLDRSAMLAIQLMPYWTPAIAGGKKINSYFILPIQFTITS